MWLFVLETLRCWTRLHQALQSQAIHVDNNAAAPLTLVRVNSTQSSRSGQARLVSRPVCAP